MQGFLTKEEINHIMRENGIIEQEDLSLYCVTSNAAGNASPGVDDIRKLFEYLDRDDSGGDLPNVVCVGVQEIVELSAANLLSSSASTLAAARWSHMCLQVLNSLVAKRAALSGEVDADKIDMNSYIVVKEELMVGLFIVLFCSKTVRPFLKHVTSGQLPRGVDLSAPGMAGNVMGNKGAVCIRCSIQDSTVCFVNSHLAAHRHHVKRRNEDYHGILYGGMFPDPYYEASILNGELAYAGKRLRLQNSLKSIRRALELKQVDISVLDSSSTAPASSSSSPGLAVGDTPGESDSPGQEPQVVQEDTEESAPSPTLRESLALKKQKAVLTSKIADPQEGVDDEEYSSSSDEEELVRASMKVKRSIHAELSDQNHGVPLFPVTQNNANSELKDPLDDHSETVRLEEEAAAAAAAEKEYRAHNLRYLNLRTMADEGHKLCVDDHDIVIWLGDLNYRVDECLSNEEVFSYIDADMTLELAENFDQLNLERNAGRAFEDFNEGLLSFPPSYKYIPGTNKYDRRKEKGNRCPAWCDRILWRTRIQKKPELILRRNERLHGGNNTSRSCLASHDSHSFPDGSTSPEGLYSLKEIDLGQGFSKVPIFRSGSNLGNIASDLEAVKNIRGNIFCDYASNGLSNPDSMSVQLMHYGYIRSFSLSDHKPIDAMFHVKLRRVDWAQRERLLIDIMEYYGTKDGFQDMQNRLYNDGTALVVADPTSLLMYSNNREQSVAFLEFSNTGRNDSVLVCWNESAFPDWITAVYAEGASAGNATLLGEVSQSESEDTSEKRALLAPDESISIKLTTNNVAAMVEYASSVNDVPLLKLMEEESNEVCFLFCPTVRSLAGLEISRMFIPIVLGLRREPASNQPHQSGQIDTVSLLHKLNRLN